MKKSGKDTVKPYGLFAMARYVLVLGAKKKPLLAPLALLLSIGLGIGTTVYTFVKQMFFESVEALVAGNTRAAVVAGYGILVSLFPMLFLLVRAVYSAVVMTFYGVAQGYMGQELNAKAARVDPLVYEDNRFLDQVNKAYYALMYRLSFLSPRRPAYCTRVTGKRQEGFQEKNGSLPVWSRGLSGKAGRTRSHGAMPAALP